MGDGFIDYRMLLQVWHFSVDMAATGYGGTYTVKCGFLRFIINPYPHFFLLLRFWPSEWSLPAYWPEVWTISHPANAIAVAIAICVFSAFITTHMSRQHADAKNTIAYATMTQLAIIYIEIFFGLRTLALIHVVSHGIYRTFEFLRTPSLLHFYHTMETRLPKMTNTGKHFTTLLPEWLRNRLYALSIKEFGFFSRAFDFIDYFLGLKFMRYDGKVSRRFAVMIAAVWVVFSVICLLLSRNFSVWKISPITEGIPSRPSLSTGNISILKMRYYWRCRWVSAFYASIIFAGWVCFYDTHLLRGHGRN